MKWQELTEKHAQEYTTYLNGYKESLEQVNQDRKKVLEAASCTEQNIPEHLNNVLTRDFERWSDEWGMYGTRFKELRLSQQREVNQYFYRENLVYRLTKATDKSQSKNKDNEGGR